MYKHLGIDDWLFVALYGAVAMMALQALSTDGEIEDDGREDKGSALRAEGLARRPALGIPKGDACYQRDARRGKSNLTNLTKSNRIYFKHELPQIEHEGRRARERQRERSGNYP